MSSEPGLDTARVGPWLAEHVTNAEPPFAFHLVAAGGSNLTYQVRDAADGQWALRRPPVGHALPTAHDMGREWRLLVALDPTPVPVPAPVAFCEDPAVTGAPFYVMGFAEGRILRDQAVAGELSAEEAEVATASLVAVQVALGALDVDEIGLGTFARRDDYVGRQLARWRRQVEAAAVRPTPLMVELHGRLERDRPPERGLPGLVHGDYRFDNTVLGPDSTVVAVLDWELCTIGAPAADVVWSLCYWADPGDPLCFLSDPPTLAPHFASRAEVTARYEAAGMDLSDRRWYEVFSWWKHACILEGVYARALAGAAGGLGAQNPERIAERAEAFFKRAADLAVGVV
jgi:aminoglycoside phosphotransferase (APT) family kinase protein